MTKEKLNKTTYYLTEYSKLINQIDDYLEYRYRNDTPDQIKKTILGFMDETVAKMAERQRDKD